jgi:hypothetical protein
MGGGHLFPPQKNKNPRSKIGGASKFRFRFSYRSELPLGRAGSAESPNSFRWLFTSRSA